MKSAKEFVGQLLRPSLRYLERLELVRFQTLAYVRILGLSFPMDQYLRAIYGRGTTAGGRRRNSRRDDLFRREPRSIANCTQSYHKLQSVDDPAINARLVRRIFRGFHLFRRLSHLWMIYIVLKYPVTVGPLFGRSKVHCYLAGRLVAYEGLSEVTEFLMAVAHLAWRSIQTLRLEPYNLNVLEFLLMSERELDLLYTNLNPRQTIEMSPDDYDTLHPRTRTALKTICYPVQHNSKLVFRLRFNRGRSSLAELQRLIARLTHYFVVQFVTVAIVMHTLITIHLLADENYSKMYPNCGPQDDEAPRLLNPHRLYVLFMDSLENVLVYFEDGLTVYVAMSCILVLNKDLIEHWNGIDKRISHLLELIRGQHEARRIAFKRRSLTARSHGLEQDIRELLVTIGDFYKQVSRINEVVSKFLAGMVIGLLLICCVFTYHMRTQAIYQLPYQVGLMAALLALWMLTASYGFVIVHRRCERSYPNLCSLIAHDSTKSIHNYEAVLEFYEKKGSCFTLMANVPFLPTTLLTMIGWAFSCFCVISSLLRDSEMHSIIRTRGQT